jgi:putative sigma-54 modulation protein
MRVTITVRHCEIEQPLRERITRETEGLSGIFDRIVNADVVLEEDAGIARAEIVLHFNQQVFNSSGEGATHSQAFDIAYEKMERQLRKYKGKLVGRRSEKPEQKSTEETDNVV